MQETVLESRPATGSAPGDNWLGSLGNRARNEPVAAFFVVTIFATVIAFFFLIKLYAGAPIMVWAWRHWLPNLNQEHGKLVIPIALALVWYHRKKLQAAPKQ